MSVELDFLCSASVEFHLQLMNIKLLRDIKQWKPQHVVLSVLRTGIALAILIMGIVGWKRTFRDKVIVLS